MDPRSFFGHGALTRRRLTQALVASATALPMVVSAQSGAPVRILVGFPPGAGSDAHVPLAIGSAYVEMPDFDGPADFLAKLRLGRTVGHHWDEPRPWSARVLPSTSSE